MEEYQPLHKPWSYEEKDLMDIRSRLDTGQLSMTRKLMERVIFSLEFGPYLNPINGRDLYEVIREEENWIADWVHSAKPEWLDVMADILSNPPPHFDSSYGSSSDAGFTYDFAQLFEALAKQFPVEAVKLLNNLMQDETIRSRIINVVFDGEELTGETWLNQLKDENY